MSRLRSAKPELRRAREFKDRSPAVWSGFFVAWQSEGERRIGSWAVDLERSVVGVSASNVWSSAFRRGGVGRLPALGLPRTLGRGLLDASVCLRLSRLKAELRTAGPQGAFGRSLPGRRLGRRSKRSVVGVGAFNAWSSAFRRGGVGRLPARENSGTWARGLLDAPVCRRLSRLKAEPRTAGPQGAVGRSVPGRWSGRGYGTTRWRRERVQRLEFRL